MTRGLPVTEKSSRSVVDSVRAVDAGCEPALGLSSERRRLKISLKESNAD
jgi:hypothetical protein